MKSEVFQSGIESDSNAIIRSGEMLWSNMCEGYKLAANLLVQYVIDNHSKQDFLIYPIAYLYRHSIELNLKYIVFHGSILFKEKSDIVKTHNLEDLWQKSKRVIRKRYPNGDKSILELAESVIGDINNLDSDSQCFRYHKRFNKKSDVLQETTDLINIRILGDKLAPILVFLDGCCDGIANSFTDNSF